MTNNHIKGWLNPCNNGQWKYFISIRLTNFNISKNFKTYPARVRENRHLYCSNSVEGNLEHVKISMYSLANWFKKFTCSKIFILVYSSEGFCTHTFFLVINTTDRTQHKSNPLKHPPSPSNMTVTMKTPIIQCSLMEDWLDMLG